MRFSVRKEATRLALKHAVVEIARSLRVLAGKDKLEHMYTAEESARLRQWYKEVAGNMPDAAGRAWLCGRKAKGLIDTKEVHETLHDEFHAKEVMARWGPVLSDLSNLKSQSQKKGPS